MCLHAHPIDWTDGVQEREGERKEGSSSSMKVQTVETDGCSVTTCLRGNNRACTLVKAGEQGEELTEMRWGGKTEKTDRSKHTCFVVFLAVWVSIKAFESILARKHPPSLNNLFGQQTWSIFGKSDKSSNLLGICAYIYSQRMLQCWKLPKLTIWSQYSIYIRQLS